MYFFTISVRSILSFASIPAKFTKNWLIPILFLTKNSKAIFPHSTAPTSGCCEVYQINYTEFGQNAISANAKCNYSKKFDRSGFFSHLSYRQQRENLNAAIFSAIRLLIEKLCRNSGFESRKITYSRQIRTYVEFSQISFGL